MAKTIALVNMKGGVGKSTLTVNLAWQFAAYTKWRKNVLVVDLDPQFNASQYLLGTDTYAKKIMQAGAPTVWDVFEQLTRTPGSNAPKLVTPQSAIVTVRKFKGGQGAPNNRLDLLASRLELAYSLRQPAQKEQLLAKFLQKVSNHYDLILIDCAPTESVLTTAAYLASDHIVVPVRPEYLSTIGLPLLVRSLQEFRQQYEDHEVDLLGIVFNNASNYQPEEAKSKAEVRAEAKKRGWQVFTSEVSYSRSYPTGARQGKPIFWTSGAHTTRKTNFHAFAMELATQLGL